MRRRRPELYRIHFKIKGVPSNPCQAALPRVAGLFDTGVVHKQDFHFSRELPDWVILSVQCPFICYPGVPGFLLEDEGTTQDSFRVAD